MRRVPVLLEWGAFTAALLCMVWLAAYQQWFWRLDLTAYDTALRAWQRPPHPDILIAAIDQSSLDALGRWPWSRALHAAMLDRLTEAGAAAVADDVALIEGNSSGDPAERALIDALRRNAKTVLAGFAEQRGQHIEPVMPAAHFAAVAAAVGHVSLELDLDGIGRSVYLSEGHPNAQLVSLAVATLAVTGRITDLPGRRPPPSMVPQSSSSWVRDYQYAIPFAGAPGHFPRVSAIDLLFGRVPAERIRGKLVLVGATAVALGDQVPTPLSGYSREMSGVEVQANIVSGLLDGIDIRLAPAAAAAWWSCLFPLLAMLAGLLLAPRQALIAQLALAIALLAITLLLPRLAQLWLPPAAAMLGVALSYPLWSWRRLESATRYLDDELARLQAEARMLPVGILPHLSAPRVQADPVATRLRSLQRATEQVRALRRFVRETLDRQSDGLIVADQEWRVRLINGQALRMLDGDESSIVGGPLIAALSRLDAKLEWARELNDLVPDQILQRQLRVGERADLLLSFATFDLSEISFAGLLVNLTDITALKDAERARGDTLRFLSHDMRAPQVSILALVQQQDATQSPVEHFLRQVSQLARTTLDLAEDYVLLARAESLPETRLLELDLVEVLHAALDQVFPQAQARGIGLVRLMEPESAWVLGDRSLLQRALVNLLSNALKYSPRGSEVQATLVGSLGQYRVSIVDRGAGIDPQDLPHLFERFHRSRNTEHEPGSGLGLALVDAVARLHRGSATVQSESGGGSVFCLVLPALDPAK